MQFNAWLQWNGANPGLYKRATLKGKRDSQMHPNTVHAGTYSVSAFMDKVSWTSIHGNIVLRNTKRRDGIWDMG